MLPVKLISSPDHIMLSQRVFLFVCDLFFIKFNSVCSLLINLSLSHSMSSSSSCEAVFIFFISISSWQRSPLCSSPTLCLMEMEILMMMTRCNPIVCLGFLSTTDPSLSLPYQQVHHLSCAPHPSVLSCCESLDSSTGRPTRFHPVWVRFLQGFDIFLRETLL